MKDKLAEEILKKSFKDWSVVKDLVIVKELIKAIQDYHEAKLKEITDADIEAWQLKSYLT